MKRIMMVVALGAIITVLSVTVIHHRAEAIKWRRVYKTVMPGGMYPKWQGYDIRNNNEFTGGGDDIVCIVQYMYLGSTLGKLDNQRIREMREEMATSAKLNEQIRGDYPLLSYIPVKGWSDRESINRIIDLLHNPEKKHRSDVETEDYLVLIRIDRKLTASEIVRVPFKLADDGFAVTPRGKDAALFTLLSSGLQEWQARKKAEEERIEAIYQLYQQAIKSENVDFNALFAELQKLDGLVDLKDPNELEQMIKMWDEGKRKMRGDFNTSTQDGD